MLLLPAAVAVAVFPSADFLLDELENIAADVAMVHCPKAAGAVRRAVGELFKVRWLATVLENYWSWPLRQVNLPLSGVLRDAGGSSCPFLVRQPL